MKSNIGIIINREFSTRVRKKSFIIMTILAPLAFLVMATIPFILGAINSDEVQKVAIIDRTGLYENVLKNNEDFEFVRADKTIEQYKSEGEDSGFKAVLIIDKNLLDYPNAITLFSYSQLPSGLEKYISSTLNNYLTEEKIKSYRDIPNLKNIIDNIKVDIGISSYKWNKDGEEVSASSSLSSAIGLTLTFLSYMFIMMYGSMVLQGVLEEKKNKIMEVMASTVKPFDMMMGKIIGVGLVGIFQLLVWILLGSLVLIGVQLVFLGNVYDASTLQSMDVNQFSPMVTGLSAEDYKGFQDMAGYISGINFFEIGVLFILFFIGGYFLYASIFAAIGSAVSSDEDTSQLMLPVTILMIFSLYAGIGSMENPEGPLAFWCSLIPFTSSIVMMVRLPFDVPIWQEILSVTLLYSTFIVFTWISGKIYRVGILMYGKKPSLKELWKWTKYK